MRPRLASLVPGACVAWLAGCGAGDELRLHLVEVDPDPLEGVAALRLTYDAGSGDESVELAVLDGAIGGDAGIRGDHVRDLRLEALDDRGEVVARGARWGDLTPPPGEGRDEDVVLLRTGVFSTVAGVALDAGRADACAVPAGAGGLWIAGGGEQGLLRLDLDRATVEVAGELVGLHEDCRWGALDDGAVVVAGDGGGVLDVFDHDEGTLLSTGDSARSDGALAILDGGSAAWWMGGGDELDLTSTLVLAGQHALLEGPVVHGGGRAGHRAACVEDGAACVFVGADDGSTTWWRVPASSVLQAGPGTAIEPLEHEDPSLVGVARDAARLDDDSVVALLEHGGGSTLHGLELDGDGVWEWHSDPGLDAGGTLLSVDGDGVWLIGGRAGAAADGVWRVHREGATWSLDELGAPLQEAREQAAATVLGDGRVVVVGGRAGGAALTSVEVYQP